MKKQLLAILLILGIATQINATSVNELPDSIELDKDATCMCFALNSLL